MKRKFTRIFHAAGFAAVILSFAYAPIATNAQDGQQRIYNSKGSNLQPNSSERRNEVSFKRGRYNIAQFNRHNRTFRYSAAFHFQHGKQHDVLQLTPLADRERVDADFDRESTDYVYKLKARTEPTMEMFGPSTARFAWAVYRAIDWTHDLHEQTYDIMSDKGIPWSEKKAYTDRSVKYYLEQNPDVARSIAPLDVTMRRAAVMMKPYFTYFRNYYPNSNHFTYVAHWWHPVVYECQMISGNDKDQEMTLSQMNATMLDEVFKQRPERMLLLREAAPRYSRLSPEAANAFDNLHMLHGIVYDIMAYEKWTPEQKRAELYRVVRAMAYQPGDERYVRKFSEPYPDMDPRVYYDWMKGADGEMSRIMEEMMMEMMPMMMQQMGMPASDELKMAMMMNDKEKMMRLMSPEMKEMHEKMMAQFKMKMMPGMQSGEAQGSLSDAMMKLMPNMKMMPESMNPGATPQMMADMMMQGWRMKYGNMPDIAPMDMSQEPPPPAALPNKRMDANGKS
jgi:hypothetical protein